MKQHFVAITAILMLTCGFSVNAQNANEHEFDNQSVFSIKRGTNIAHWLSQSEKRGQERAEFFTKKDIDFIKSAGFDHIRLPVDEEQLVGQRREKRGRSLPVTK